MSGGNKRVSMKLKLFFGLLATVLAAVAVVCFVTLEQPKSTGSVDTQATVSHKRSLESITQDKFTQEQEVLRVQAKKRTRRQARVPLNRGGSENTNSNHDVSCSSQVANDTVPAAHISGFGEFKKPMGTSPPEAPTGYQQNWRCMDMKPKPHEEGSNHMIYAFVDGGMSFVQSTKKLRVPKCGYYHIASQIQFVYKNPTNPSSASADTPINVYHQIKYSRNCEGWEEEQPLVVIGRSTISQGTSTTTYVSDIVKLCTDGTVNVEIPETSNSNVYPHADSHSTYLSAILVAETSCVWPPPTTISHDQ